jgi:hypothetical protein
MLCNGTLLKKSFGETDVQPSRCLKNSLVDIGVKFHYKKIIFEIAM